jgi:hypothetical protein
MPQQIFVSYSRKDLQTVRELYRRLTDMGYSLWFDQESLLAGQDWEQEIRRAIKSSSAVLMCLSSNWVGEPGYVQKELKLALEVMKEMPEGRIHTIPVRLDDCQVPPALERLHWVDMTAPQGLARLTAAIDAAVGRSKPPDREERQSINAYSEFMEDIIAKGGIIHRDPWKEASSQEELEFKALLKGRWNKSLDYLQAERYEAILELWEPLIGNPFFKVDHDEWKDKPFFRVQIHSAKCMLFMAYVQLGASRDWKSLTPKAFGVLKEVLAGPPYSMKGASHDRLSTDDALTQNLNYKQTLEFALEWLRAWGGSVLEPVGISAEESGAVEQQVHHRLYEVNYILNARGRTP